MPKKPDFTKTICGLRQSADWSINILGLCFREFKILWRHAKIVIDLKERFFFAALVQFLNLCIAENSVMLIFAKSHVNNLFLSFLHLSVRSSGLVESQLHHKKYVFKYGFWSFSKFWDSENFYQPQSRALLKMVQNVSFEFYFFKKLWDVRLKSNV